uniref:DUF2231 domain-containing protein n=1 Tax=Altererythrobacter segetis TaxID=1104773 RepID=UPI00140BE910|nr:DUF2231 domain-containing protein [Altererythrobacter segetis]
MKPHPIHPALVHFPLGLLLTATIVDLAHWAGLWTEPYFAAWLMAAGLIAALPAMAAGLYDFAKLDEAVVPHALRHMGAMALSWLGYAVALYLRRDGLIAAADPSTASLAMSVASALVLGLGGWLGGELVYRYGAGRIDR